MTRGESWENQNEKKENVLSEDVLKILKSYEDKVKNLENKIATMSSGGSSTSESDILRLAEAITNKTKKELDYEEGIDVSQIPHDDYLEAEKWVRFCVPKAGYVIVDDVRSGRIVKLPYGKKSIFFQYLLTNRKQNGKNVSTIPVATYTCKSKAEADWIRGHSLFGTLIFEDLGSIGNTDAEKALRLGAIIESVGMLDHATIISQATKDYGLPFDADPERLKRSLAYAILQKEYKDQEQVSERIAQETYKSKVLLGRD